MTLHNLGLIFYELGDYRQATDVALQSLRLHEENENTQGVVLALTNLGRIAFRMEDTETARSYYERGLTIARSLDLPSLTANLLNNLGVMKFETEDFTVAKTYFEEAATLHRASHEPRFLAASLANVGNCHRELGEWDASLTAYKEAARLVQELDDTFRIAEHKIALAELYARSDFPANDLNYAKRLLEEALTVADALGSVQLQRHLHQPLAKVEKARGDFARALAHFERFYELDRVIFNEERDRYIKSLQILHEVEQARKNAEIAHLRNVELAQANAELERLNREDSLSGLLNRRALDERLSITFAEANRYGTPLSVVILDLDRFKSINDTFGHGIGDEVIRAVARILWGRCRESDAAGRYGGEEFCLLLPHTDATGARTLCEELRESIEAYDWKRIHPDLAVTSSFGFSTDTSLPDGESMVKVADDHLYTAKQTGRNRVVG